MIFTDYVHNGAGHGPVGSEFARFGFDPGIFRPYIDQYGQRVVSMNTGRMLYNNQTGVYFPERKKVSIAALMQRGFYHPVFNATSLRKEQWVMLETAVVEAARERLRAYGDLLAFNRFGGFNAMAKATLEYEAASDPGEAVVDMDAITDGRNDFPLYKLRSIPLPITHSDFGFSERRLLISGSSPSTPLDTTMARNAGRRVAEMIERITIGTVVGITAGTVASGPFAHDGTSTVYGMTTFPSRLTKTNMTVPTGSNPEVTVSDVLAARQQLYAAKQYGPYMIYHSTDWDTFLDNDYARLGGNNASQTLRDRIRAIEGIIDVRRLDFLTNTYTMVMVQMTEDVARAIDGMPITVVQWSSKGGLMNHYKVMTIQVPQFRADYYGNCGICHMTTA